MARKQASRGARGTKAEAKPSAEAAGAVHLYTLEVAVLGGPGTEAPALEQAVSARTIQVRGDQTLEDLHRGIADAFGRAGEHSYEFHLGKGPIDPQGPRYVLPGAFEVSVEDGAPAAGRVDRTTLDSLALAVGRRFGYLLDAGDDWWHAIRVERVEDRVPRGKYPKVTRRLGPGLPPSAGGAEGSARGGPQDLSGRAAADAACLVGELHLRNGDYHKAVEAFSRALASSPTADAHEGRAKAYRGLADADERAAQGLR